MRDYGKVHTKFWSSDTTRGLSDDGRLLALYLITSPHSTIAGAFRLPDGYVCEDMQWSAERVAQAFAELLSKGFANRCETTKWVWIAKHLEWNPPENPNQRKSAAKVALGIPDECCWKLDFMRVCGPSLGVSEPQKANPSETVPQPFLNQEPEPEQEQESKSPKAPAPKASALPTDWTLPEEWRLWAEAQRPELDPDRVAAKFADYWRGKGGKDGRKLDWFATWRNWIRDERLSDATRRNSPHQESFV